MDRKGKGVKLTEKRKDMLFGYALLLPTFLVFALVVLYPIANGVVMSFSDYTYITVAKGKGFQWNGFANYKTVVEGGLLKQLGITLAYTVSTVLLELAIGMAVALMLDALHKGSGFLRSVFLMPWTIPSIVTALLWSWLFQAQFGVVNFFFGTPNKEWVQDPETALLTVIVANVWRQTPYMLIMLLAALQNVRQDLVEAAVIDGAGPAGVFRHVKLPAIRPVLGTTLITCVMSSFQQFTIIYNMTGGGPVDATTTLSIAAYKQAFTQMNLGAGASIGVIWMVILTVGISVFNAKTRRFDTI